MEPILISARAYYERRLFIDYSDFNPIVVDSCRAALDWLRIHPAWTLWITDYTFASDDLQPALNELTDRFHAMEDLYIERIVVSEPVLEDGIWATMSLHKLGYQVTHQPDNFPENSVYARTILQEIADGPVATRSRRVYQLPTLRDPATGLPRTWEPGQPNRPSWRGPW